MTTPRSTVRKGIAMVLAPTTALASGLMSPVALGAPGDLDPSFGDVGRTFSALNFAGPAWSVESLDNDASIIAGGAECVDYYCSYDDDYGFVGHLSGAGAPDFNDTAFPLVATEIRDIAIQPDGKVIAVGRSARSTPMAVLRFDAQGDLDPTFGTNGVAQILPTISSYDTGAQAVTVDPDGRIVVVGAKGGRLVVLRLLANGTLDPSFADMGIFTGASNDFATTQTDIVRTSTGGYRISTNSRDGTLSCRVVGLTAAGALDSTFGNTGIATPALSIDCSSMVNQADGKLLLAGRNVQHAYVLRLRLDGTLDPDFTAPAVENTMTNATALAIDSAGAILVAGSASNGNQAALLMRLQADGALDPLYGNAGLSWIDLPSDFGMSPVVHDMAVLADGRVLAAGGTWPGNDGAPFLVRLLGVDGDSPGVVGMSQPLVETMEQTGQAVVTVRRTGGASGPVSVAYTTALYPYANAPATPGQDFTAVSGRLTWQDGDASEKQIVVPIASSDESPELREEFIVALSDAQGGAGLGTSNAMVQIAADTEPPAGQFNFDGTSFNVSESVGIVTVQVNRDYHAIGSASVTVEPVAGTAGSADFSGANQTLTWADGDSAPKSFTVTILNDSDVESTEQLTLQLSDATGGAIVGPQSVVTISIQDDDQNAPGGGGGALGLLSLIYLAAIRLLRVRHWSQRGQR